MSLKVNMMVEHIIKNNKNYDMINYTVMKQYLKDKFKCSDYMAHRVIKKLKRSDN